VWINAVRTSSAHFVHTDFVAAAAFNEPSAATAYSPDIAFNGALREGTMAARFHQLH
jgi:hypothetical protein